MGRWNHVWLKVEPRNPGEGFEFVDGTKGGAVPKEFIPAINKGILESLDSGVVAGFPIVDVRAKFNMEATIYDAFTVIVVVVVHERVMGIIVDSVSDVMNIPPSDIQPPPDFGARHSSSALKGMGKVGDKLIILLDIEAMLLGDTAVLAA